MALGLAGLFLTSSLQAMASKGTLVSVCHTSVPTVNSLSPVLDLLFWVWSLKPQRNQGTSLPSPLHSDLSYLRELPLHLEPQTRKVGEVRAVLGTKPLGGSSNGNAPRRTSFSPPSPGC